MNLLPGKMPSPKSWQNQSEAGKAKATLVRVVTFRVSQSVLSEQAANDIEELGPEEHP